MRSYRKKDILLIMSVFLLRMKSPPKKEILMIWSVTISANWKLPTSHSCHYLFSLWAYSTAAIAWIIHDQALFTKHNVVMKFIFLQIKV